MVTRVLIHGARVVSVDGVTLADILIDGERIAAVGPNLTAEDVEQVDATGLLAFPGLIDPHTHLREPGGEHKEDFLSGTSAALAGGVTTVFGMPNTHPALTSTETLNDALSRAARSAVCDFGLFLGATNTNAGLSPGLECGLKIYMGSSTGDLLVEDFAAQFAHFERYPAQRVIAVHAEHEPAVRFFAERGERRPPICAELETARAISLAGRCNRRLHICHLSTGREVELVAEAKARGVPVTCEFSPHHLLLSMDAGRHVTNRLTGITHPPSALFEMNPPLRDDSHVRALWSRLRVADCIGTDHAPHTLAEKHSARPPMGTPGLETLLPLMLTAAAQGWLPLTEIARLCCEGPAQVFGIRRKGKIAAGYDADVTLADPDVRWTIGTRPVVSKCGWNPFAGTPVIGDVHTVWVRGRVAWRDGRLVAWPGTGARVEQHLA
jgi:dihydroorotase (multifunctional complex type)